MTRLNIEQLIREMAAWERRDVNLNTLSERSGVPYPTLRRIYLGQESVRLSHLVMLKRTIEKSAEKHNMKFSWDDMFIEDVASPESGAPTELVGAAL